MSNIPPPCALRKTFEEWIKSPPYEMNIGRVPNNPEKYTWPGDYIDNTVQVAWEAWQEALNGRHKKPLA